ncbi:MAG: pentapeptide repeat-containing protein [Desulfomonile tiedjei]|uniref:Pentapeptide repeat-containing protein n=1 Tax=Desulfomonile tiedjei TaxID=2358 RepID=A0A9D6V873_9BACT|nr:pentapeptide repeat-containing protein [Desulfomonile tiedjei]
MVARTIRISALEAVRSIRSGMDDAALMDKFGISADGLQSLFRQLAAAGILAQAELSKRVGEKLESVIVDVDQSELPTMSSAKRLVDGAAVLKLIRSGASDAELMKEFNLSAKGVRSLFTKLLNLRLIKPADFQSRMQVQKSVIVDDDSGNYARRASQEVNISELLAEIKSGADRAVLQKRYLVSINELDALLNRLVDENLIIQEELDALLSRPSRSFQIKHKSSGATIFSGQAPCIAALVERAVAQGIDLSEADLAGKDLSRADFSGAQMSRANLRRTNLLRTDLTGATLAEADLQSSDMLGAILYKTNLAGANLSDTNLTMAYAVWAFLPGANLSEANLSYADFSGSNLADAYFFETILDGTNLLGAYVERVGLESTKMNSIAVKAFRMRD